MQKKRETLLASAVFLILIILIFSSLQKPTLTGFAVYDSSNPDIDSCGQITQAGVYYLTQDIDANSTCIEIQADNVILNLNRFHITGKNNYHGINATQQSDIIILNGTISNFSDGIKLSQIQSPKLHNLNLSLNNRGAAFLSCTNIQITNVTSNHNTRYGLDFYETSGTNLKNITTNNNRESGIRFSGSPNNTLTRITASNNSQHGITLGTSFIFNGLMSNSSTLFNITTNNNSECGIYLSRSSRNTLKNIVANRNQHGIFLYSLSSNNSVENVTANYNEEGLLVTSAESTFTNIFPSFNNYGIKIENQNNTLDKITSTNNIRGVYLGRFSKNCKLSNFTLESNSFESLWVDRSQNHFIEQGKINSASGTCIRIYSDKITNNASDNLFKNLNLSCGSRDIHIDSGDDDTHKSVNNTFLNVSYNESKVLFESCSNCRIELIRKWYLQTQVWSANGGGQMSGVSVEIYNQSADLQISDTTNQKGLTEQHTLIEYIQDETMDKIKAPSNYSVNISLTNYGTNSTSVNLTSNQLIHLRLTDTIPPEFINIKNKTFLVNTSLQHQISVQDASVIDSFSLNDSTRFKISHNGLIENNTKFVTKEIHWLEVTVRDSAGNENTAKIFINVSLDDDPPEITLIHPPDWVSAEVKDYNFTFNVTDNSDIESCDLVIDDEFVDSSLEITRSLEEGIYYDGLSVGDHNWNINCTDVVGNTDSSPKRNIEVTPPSNDDDPNDNGGGPGSGYHTYTLTNAQFRQGESRNLERNDRIRFYFENSLTNQRETHYVVLKEFYIDKREATIEVTNRTSRLNLSLGGETKVDLNSDQTYDVLIRFASITSNKAEIFLKSISEAVPDTPPPDDPNDDPDPDPDDPAEDDPDEPLDFWLIVSVALGALVTIAIVILVIVLINKNLRKKEVQKIAAGPKPKKPQPPKKQNITPNRDEKILDLIDKFLTEGNKAIKNKDIQTARSKYNNIRKLYIPLRNKTPKLKEKILKLYNKINSEK